LNTEGDEIFANLLMINLLMKKKTERKQKNDVKKVIDHPMLLDTKIIDENQRKPLQKMICLIQTKPIMKVIDTT